jgi:hypothetical protein
MPPGNEIACLTWAWRAIVLPTAREVSSLESDPDLDNLEFAAAIVQEAITALDGFPAGYVPPQLEVPRPANADSNIGLVRAVTTQEMLTDPVTVDWLNATYQQLPKGVRSTFISATRMIGHLLGMFVPPGRNLGGLIGLNLADPQALEMMLALAKLSKEPAASQGDGGEVEDPMGMKFALVSELQRRAAARNVPFGHTLSTMLGHNAVLWLTSQSEEGIGKIQPHEFARSGWHQLFEIETQIAIERELLRVPSEAAMSTKLLVALAWTALALASFMPPAIFLGENDSRLVSIRPGNYTVSSGVGSHTLILFDTDRMRAMLRILRDGLANPQLTPQDLMWIGAALLRIREVQVRHMSPSPVLEERFEVFLSQRGLDAKPVLLQSVQELPHRSNIFLDCTTMPRGIINRGFVYRAMAHSERIVIVETDNYQASPWCRKEAWFSEAMANEGLVRVERRSLGEAREAIQTAGNTAPQRLDPGHQYSMTHRIMMDIDYWARVPNLHSLRKEGGPAEIVQPLLDLLKIDKRPTDEKSVGPDWFHSLGTVVAETLGAAQERSPAAKPIDLWATAMQLAVGALGISSAARSKDEVRHGIDNLNRTVRTFVEDGMHEDPEFLATSGSYLAAIAAAATIHLAGFAPDPHSVLAMRAAIGNAAVLHDDVLLFDVRPGGERRSFRLRLAVLLLKCNIGAVGIIQEAADEVHNTVVNEFPLEVLPCVTIYPGMRAPGTGGG